jgi:hypothetical protein
VPTSAQVDCITISPISSAEIAQIGDDGILHHTIKSGEHDLEGESFMFADWQLCPVEYLGVFAQPPKKVYQGQVSASGYDYALNAFRF